MSRISPGNGLTIFDRISSTIKSGKAFTSRSRILSTQLLASHAVTNTDVKPGLGAVIYRTPLARSVVAQLRFVVIESSADWLSISVRTNGTSVEKDCSTGIIAGNDANSGSSSTSSTSTVVIRLHVLPDVSVTVVIKSTLPEACSRRRIRI